MRNGNEKRGKGRKNGRYSRVRGGGGGSGNGKMPVEFVRAE